LIRERCQCVRRKIFVHDPTIVGVGYVFSSFCIIGSSGHILCIQSQTFHTYTHLECMLYKLLVRGLYVVLNHHAFLVSLLGVETEN